jgi:PAS domain S-box-containing protein
LTSLSEFRLRVGAAAAAMLIFCATPSKAVDPHRMISQYARDHWTIENEFPGGAISAIAQTPDGYLWIGTEKGLFRFDGLSFRVFQQASPEPLPIGPVQQLMTDNTGNLWVLLANTQLLRFHDGKFELGREEAEVGVTAIGKRANGTPLFASLAYGALTYQDGKFLSISPSSDLSATPTAPSSDDLSTRLSWATSVAAHSLAQPDSVVTSMVETSDGRLWLGTRDKGLFYLDHGRISSVRLPGVSRNVRSLLPLENGELWIGTERGIFRWNGKEVSQIGISPALRQAQVHAMIRDRDANVWVGTTAGLVRVNNEGVSFDDVGSDRAKPVSALFEDREGHLWIGGSQGIERLRETAFVTYPFRTSQEESGGPVFVDASGRVWFASFKGGLQWLRQGQGGIVSNDDLNQDVVYSITGGDDELWIGRQRGGLTRLRYGAGRITARTYTVSDGLPENSVYAVYGSRDGSVWAATLNAGLSQFVNGRFQTYSTANGLPSNTITSIDEGPDDTMWFGTPNGLVAFSRNKWSVFTSRDGLPNDNITCLLTDSTNTLWIGTASGLAFLRSGHIQKAYAPSLQEEILGIAADDIGNLWIATTNHILSVKRDRLLSNTVAESDLREYGLEDGLIGKQGVKRFRSVVSGPQGRIWFSTSRGLSVVDPSRAGREPPYVTVQIEGFSADGNSLDLQPPIRVPPDTHRLRFSYSGLSLSSPERIQFKYKLDGFDKDWSEPVSTRAAVYTNVGRGSYTFRVMASNSAGAWNNQSVALPFSIAPTLYQTRAFRVLLAASLLLGTWALHRWRIHQLTAQEKRMRDVVETIPAMTFTTSSDGSCTFVNKRWTEYTGLSVEQSSGTGWQSAVHAEDFARYSETWRISVATEQLFEDEARFRRAADGGYRWFLVRGVPLRDQHGRIVRWYGTLTDIEDRKRAEEAMGGLSRDLQESKAKLEEAQRIAHVGYWEWDLTSNRVIWSDETYRIYGLRPQEHPIDIAVIQKMIHPEDLEFVFRVAEEAVRGGLRTDVQHRIIRTSGELRTVHSQGDLKKDASGRPCQMFGTVQDVTDRKRAEEALQQSQFYLSEGQRLAHMGSWAFNPAGFFYYWSEELFRIYGLDPQRGAPTLEQYLATVHPQDRDFMADTIKRMHAERSGCDVKKRIVRPDGEQRYIRCVGIPVLEGEVLKGFLGTAIDITEQELLNQELERRQAHLTEAQKLTHTASWAWRVPDRNAVEVSEEFYRIGGFDPAEGPPSREEYLERVHPEDRLKWTGITERAIVEKADYDHEFRILFPNGKVKWIHTVGHPVLSDTGDLEQFVGSSTDITERKSAEQEREKLRQLEADLAHIDRVSTLGEMAASLAHEIKQPIAAAITSANSCIEWLAHEPPNLDRARAAAARIDRYGNRAAEIIDRIRSFYKKSPPQRELVDVNGIIQEMITLLQGEATRSSIAMHTELTAEIPKITADRVQLQQVFMNLMLNGIEAMKDAGGELTVTSHLQDGQLQFSVSDTGVGLPAEKMDQIFSAFFTTKPQGSGMGLAISRSIVESHGGRLWAAANDGRGATFHFTLPTHVTS